MRRGWFFAPHESAGNASQNRRSEPPGQSVRMMTLDRFRKRRTPMLSKSRTKHAGGRRKKTGESAVFR